MKVLSNMRAAVTRQRRIWAEGHAAAKLARRAARGGFFQLDWGRTAASIAAVRSGAIQVEPGSYWALAAQEAELQEAELQEAARAADRKAA